MAASKECWIEKPAGAEYDLTILKHVPEFESKKLEVDPDLVNKHGEHEWHNIPAETFDVRWLNYGENREKKASKKSMYEVQEICMYETPKKVLDCRKLLKLPPVEKNPKCKLPHYLIFNVVLPTYQPGLWSNLADGSAQHFIVVCTVDPEVVQRYEDEKKEPLSAEKLFERFLYKPGPPVENYSNVRRRLKCINRMSNFNPDKSQFNWAMTNMIKSYNGTPFLIRDSSSFYIEDNFAVVTVDINIFGRLAKNSLWQVRQSVELCVMDICLFVEGDGKDNDELPENILCAFRCSKSKVFPR